MQGDDGTHPSSCCHYCSLGGKMVGSPEQIKLRNCSPDNFDFNVPFLPRQASSCGWIHSFNSSDSSPRRSRPGPVSPRLLCLMQRLYNINNNIIIIYIVQAGVFAGVKYSTTAGRRGFIGAAAFICGVRLPGRPIHWGCNLGRRGPNKVCTFNWGYNTTPVLSTQSIREVSIPVARYSGQFASLLPPAWPGVYTARPTPGVTRAA